jgi:hypothetical protein
MKSRPRAVSAVTSLAIGLAVLQPLATPATNAADDTMTLLHQELAIAPDAPLTVVVHPPLPFTDQTRVTVSSFQQIVTREALQIAIDNGPRRFVDSVTLDAAGIAVGADGSLTLTIPTESTASSQGALRFSNEGLYPLQIRINDGSRIAGELVTFVYRLGQPDAEPLGSMNVAVVASVTAPPAVPGVDSALPPDVIASVSDLAAYDDLVTTLKPTVAISPEILTSNRVDPDTLARLRTVLSQSVLLSQPRVPLDPSSAVASGQTDRFTQMLRAGENATASVAEVPTADREVWATTDPITTEGASMLRNLGFRLILMSPDNYYAAKGSVQGFTDFSQLFEINLPDGTAMPMGVIDPALNDRLLDTRWSPEQAALFAAADIVVWRDQLAETLSPVSGRTVALGLTHGGVPNPALIKRIAEMASSTGAATFTTGLSDYERSTEYQLINGLRIDVTLQATPVVDLTTRAQSLNVMTLKSTAVSSMLVEDNGRTAQWALTVDTLWSTSLDDDDVDAGLTTVDGELAAITGAVVPPQPYSFSLSGRRATVPVRITNTSNEPLRVVVRLSAAADKLTFPNGDQVAELTPNDVTDVDVPVIARTNGFFEVRVDILTPQGSAPIAATTFRANVNALTGLAQVLTGALLLILITWWVRNFRRGRRVRRSLQALPTHPSSRVAQESGNGSAEPGVEHPPAAANDAVPEHEGAASATLSDS